LNSKLVSGETRSKEHVMRVEKEKKRLEEQQQRLEARIAELEVRVVAAERDSKMFADMYESTKSSLKASIIYSHSIAILTRRIRKRNYNCISFEDIQNQELLPI